MVLNLLIFILLHPKLFCPGNAYRLITELTLSLHSANWVVCERDKLLVV